MSNEGCERRRLWGMAIGIAVADGVARVAGAAEAPFERLREALDGLTAGFEVRVVVWALEGGGEPLRAEEGLWLEEFPIPLLAVLRGTTSGRAADLALWSDIRIADRSLSLRWGRFGSGRLLRVLGAKGSVVLLEGGGALDAEAALAVGAVSGVFDDVDLEGARLARAIAARGPIALRLAKEALRHGPEMALSQALRFETDLTLLLQTTKDRAEGVRAFMEKRRPNFTGS